MLSELLSIFTCPGLEIVSPGFQFQVQSSSVPNTPKRLVNQVQVLAGNILKSFPLSCFLSYQEDNRVLSGKVVLFLEIYIEVPS